MGDRDGLFAVLVIVKEEGRRDGLQLVTYGREANDKLAAHNLKEWIKSELFDGDPPLTVSHESFILDAAKNKELKDELLTAIQRLRKAIHDEIGVNPAEPEIEIDRAVAEADRAIAKAKGGGK